MANAFDPGRVGVYVISQANLSNGTRGVPAIAKLYDGMFTDVFVREDTTLDQMNYIRSITRPDNTKMRAQVWAVPKKNEATGVLETADEFAQRVSNVIKLLSPGVVSLDIEVSDDQLYQYLDETVNALRTKVVVSSTQIGRPTFILAYCLDPNKIPFLPVGRVANDPNLYVQVQTYFGDMSPIATDDLENQLFDAGVSRNKFAMCYGAGGPVKRDGTRGITLPSVLYKGQYSGHKLRRGGVYSDDLMYEVGLFS